MFRSVVLQQQLLFLFRYSRQPVWHIIIGKNYILEELTTEGDRIPKIKLHENIHRNFLCTLGEENSEVEGKEYEGPQKREKEGNYFWYQTQQLVIWKAYRCACLNSTLRKKQASPIHPAPQTGNEKRQKNQTTHKKQLIPILD